MIVVLFHADRQKDRLDKAYICSLQLPCERSDKGLWEIGYKPGIELAQGSLNGCLL